MVKFVTQGGRLLGLGLTDDNLARLRKGEPILFDLADLGWRLVRASEDAGPSRVLIMHGKSESDIAEALGLAARQPGPGEEIQIRFDRPGSDDG